MITDIFLWSVLLLFAFHFAGHLHNMTANLPNWSSGSVDDVHRMVQFYHKANNTRYFAPVIFASTVMCTVALVVVWQESALLRNLLLADLLIAVGTLFAVLILFRPLNKFFTLEQNDPAALKKAVNKWLLYNYVRVAAVLVGLGFAVKAMNVYQGLH